MNKIIDRPVLASIFFVLVIIFGYYSFKNMPIELVPGLEEGLPSLYVNYMWQGASPDMILKRALIPAEEEIMQIKGVEKLTSRAGQDSGWLKVEFNRNTRMNFANVVLKERLNRLKKEMPLQIEGPEIQADVPGEFAKRALFRIGIYGKNYSLPMLRRLAESEIIPRLKSVAGVDTVSLYGGVDQEIKIQTMMSKLRLYDIDIRDIQYKLTQYFYSQKSITMSKKFGEITISLSENPSKIEDIRNIVVKSEGQERLYLKDVANVFMGYQKLNEESRYQGVAFVQLEIQKELNQSLLDVAERVRAKLKQLTNRMEGRIEFIIQSDDSKELKKQLWELGKVSFLILALIFLTLVVIVKDFKSSLLIFSSVFFSVCTTLTFIYLCKIPLNILTMSGLALGFGMFVDNAVVVFDSILRYREKGYAPKESAIIGAKTVVLPVLASTFTTIIVFFSFAFFFKDRLRIYYIPLAWVIAISLLSSIVVSFVLIPSLSARIRIKAKQKNIGEELFKRGKFYPFILKYPLVVIVPIILMIFFSGKLFFKEVSFGSFFSWYSDDRVTVGLRFPAGTEFDDVKNSILQFEKVALEKNYPKEVNTTIQGTMAEMDVTFPTKIKNSALPVQLKQELVGVATNLAGVGVQVAGFDQEPYYYNPDSGSYLPFSIQLTGYNFERLMDFANVFRDSLLNHKRIKEADIQTDMSYWWAGKNKFYTLKLDREKLKNYNLPPSYLLYIISSLLRENTGTNRLRFEDKDLTVEIKASDVDVIELQEILERYQKVPGIDTPFRIKDVVTLDFSTQKGGISRENQEYKAMVQWDYLGSTKSGDRFHKARYEKLEVPVGFKKSLKEEQRQMTEEEKDQLNWALLASVVLIYLVIGVLYENFFQPILIMFSIPLASIGVFLAFVWLDYSWDATAYIGVILLMGVVVNNAILLIDNINQHLEKSKKLVEAIAIGTKERIRPIIMTTLTAVLGMLPMVLFREEGAKSDIWSSLALCSVGGLTTSSILIVFVLPILYYYFYKFQQHLRNPHKKII